jgi:peptidoglycan/xylan/chitin deacetylase (PgdA/CDA1 family)
MANDNQFQNNFISYYNNGFKFRNKPGWNLINLRTSDWLIGAGTPSWSSPIIRIRLRFFDSAANSYALDGLYSSVVAQPAVLFTFDNGLSSTYDQAYAYMSTRNVRGTAYIVTNWVNNSTYMTWNQLQALYAGGWTIGNKTMSNVRLTTLSEADQEATFQGNRAALNAHGMTNVDYVAYPGSLYNSDTLVAMANLGMRTGRTLLSFNLSSPIQSPFEVAQKELTGTTTLATAQSWIDTINSRKETLVITLYGLSTSPANGTDWYVDRFQALINYCIQQGVPIITMDDLYRLQSGNITIPGPR